MSCVNFLILYLTFLICLDGSVKYCVSVFSVLCPDLRGLIICRLLILFLLFLASLFLSLYYQATSFFSSPILFVILKFVFHMLAFINFSRMLPLQLQIYFKIMKDNIIPLCSNTKP